MRRVDAMRSKKVQFTLAYYVGKQWFRKEFMELMPPHTIYVSAYGGGGSLLLSKEPSPLEVYNDLDEGMVNLFRVLRDPIKCLELKRRLELTPYSRTEWDRCRRNWKNCADDIEKARMVFVDLRQGRNGLRNSNWGRDGRKRDGRLSQNVRKYISCVDRILPEICERLKYVVFENKNALEVLIDHDSSETFGDVDPPYVSST